MDKDWRISQLEKLHSGNSIYKYVPDTIGNILYCDTTEPKESPLTLQQAKRKKISGMLFCLISLSLYWGFLYEHYIVGIIVTVIVFIITFVLCDTDFSGTDYFVGKQGFSIISFSQTRDNIVDERVYLFKDLAYLFTGEIVNKTNFSYSNTSYYFTFYEHLNPDNEVYNVAYTTNGLYSDKSPKDPMCPKDAGPDYCFMKRVEKEWTLYFFNEHKSDKSVSFPLIEDNKIYNDAIIVSSESIDVLGVKYNHNNTKRIYFSNGQLIIEHKNHSRKLLGLVEKGDISSISLSDLGNRQAFLMLFENFYKL